MPHHNPEYVGLEDILYMSDALQRPRLWVLVFFLSIYLLTFGGHFYSPDEDVIFHVTHSVVEHRSFSLLTLAEPRVLQFQMGIDGKRYSRYGWGASAVAIPFYLVGKWSTQFVQLQLQGFVARLVTALVSPIVSAISCVVVYSLAIAFFRKHKQAFLITVLFGLFTLTWPYAKMNFSESLLTMELVLAFYQLFRYTQDGRASQLVLSGFFYGLAVATKMASILFVPLAGLYLLAHLYEQNGRLAGIRKHVKHYISALLCWGIPIALLIVTVLLYNAFRRGSPFESGYGSAAGLMRYPLLEGLYGLLFSSGRSLFLYAVPTALFIPAIMAFTRSGARRPSFSPWSSSLTLSFSPSTSFGMEQAVGDRAF
ncbi:MAG: phospholipid carrier-dependent glycosyltransferase [Chloroflexi bacterium]|nr:phospholipid carrier-dependent glycosyltransferase [Chloroflexota bacterium]